RFIAFPMLPLAQGPEARANFFTEGLRLLPCGEVAAFGEPVVVNQVGIGFFCPAARRRIDLVGEDAHGDRYLDTAHVEEASPRRSLGGVPVEASRGNRRVC